MILFNSSRSMRILSSSCGRGALVTASRHGPPEPSSPAGTARGTIFSRLLSLMAATIRARRRGWQRGRTSAVRSCVSAPAATIRGSRTMYDRGGGSWPVLRGIEHDAPNIVLMNVVAEAVALFAAGQGRGGALHGGRRMDRDNFVAVLRQRGLVGADGDSGELQSMGADRFVGHCRQRGFVDELPHRTRDALDAALGGHCGDSRQRQGAYDRCDFP